MQNSELDDDFFHDTTENNKLYVEEETTCRELGLEKPSRSSDCRRCSPFGAILFSVPLAGLGYVCVELSRTEPVDLSLPSCFNSVADSDVARICKTKSSG